MYAILNSTIRAFSTSNLLNTVLKIFSVTFDAISTYQFFEFENALCNSPKIVQHKKYIKKYSTENVKTSIVLMFTQLCFIVLVLLQPKQKSYIRKSADWFSTTTHKHWEEHDLILYFHFLFKLAKTEVLIYRDVDGDSQTYSYKNVLQTYAANLHEGPCWGVTS